MTEEKDNSLEDNGNYLFLEDFTFESVRPVIEWILKENFTTGKRRKTRLMLIIGSHGGELDAMWALTDVMLGSSIPVDTLGLGTIASAGFMTFIAGKKRYLTDNTAILSHQYSWASVGKHHELVATTKQFEITHQRMIAHYQKCLKMSKKKVLDNLLTPEDKWLTSEEALELGVCHEIRTL